jgi:Cytochrome c3
MSDTLVRVARVLCRCGLVIALASSDAPAQDAGQPQLLPQIKATDCVGCHGASALPRNHPNVADQSLRDCTGCHVPGTALGLGRMPLFHAHLLSGFTCTSCHAPSKSPQPVGADVCMSCHDPDKLANATAALKAANPHNSPHYGNRADCNLCHHQHAKSENYCASCHGDFKLEVT